MDSRAARRVSVDREIRCQIGDVAEWVVLYDLSVSGAMIEVGRLGIEVGDEIQLNLHDISTASGEIAWKIDGNAGVKFFGILSNSVVEHLGFSSSALAFEEQKPRGRLGEMLSDLEVAFSVSTDNSAPEEDGLPAHWLDTAEVQQDRRRADRGDDDRRVEDRLTIAARAKLSKSIREGVEGQLLDLSTAGCNFLDNTGSFQPGDEVWLKIDGLELWRGTVRWLQSEKVGVEFDRPFYPAVFNHLVQRHRGVLVSRAA